ncbi:MAG: nucleotide exchange factor GrpE [Hydrotalea sp.]|nr:nucleotide exchange factor GrpE [Hydrotalea sp.]
MLDNDKKNNGATDNPTDNNESQPAGGHAENNQPADATADAPHPHLSDADKIAELENQLAEAKDKMLRGLADADNIKKRAMKDVEDTRKYAPQVIIREILPIFDNLAEAMKNISQEEKDANPKIGQLFNSLELIAKMTDIAFEKFAISKTASVGQKFNPNLHQALSTKPANGQGKDIIAEVLQQGYQLHDRLIRPALVVVYQ